MWRRSFTQSVHNRSRQFRIESPTKQREKRAQPWRRGSKRNCNGLRHPRRLRWSKWFFARKHRAKLYVLECALVVLQRLANPSLSSNEGKVNGYGLGFGEVAGETAGD